LKVSAGLQDYPERIVIQRSLLSKERLCEAIESGKIMSHPAWEDYILWQNKERYIEDLNGQRQISGDGINILYHIQNRGY